MSCGVNIETQFDGKLLSVLTAPPFWVTIQMNSDPKGARSLRRPTGKCRRDCCWSEKKQTTLNVYLVYSHDVI